MGLTVTLTANDAAGSSYTLIGSGSPWALIAADWGNSAWDVQYSGPRGSLGAVPVSSVPQNRTVGLTVRLLPASFDAATGHQRDVDMIVDLMRRYGGTITRRHANQTYRQHLTVFAGAATTGAWTNRAEFAGRFDGTLGFVCAPYAEGDSMEVVDLFATDTSADYTFDDGASSDVTIGSGAVAPVSTTTPVAAVHTGVGYLYGDHGADIIVTPGSTVTDFVGGVILKRTSADNYLRAYADQATSTVRLDKVVAGTPTNLASTAFSFSAVTANEAICVRAWIEGNRVRVAMAGGAGSPHPREPNRFYSTSNHDTIDHTLSTTNAALFGEGVTGQAGWLWTPRHADARIGYFRVRPYVYASSPASPSLLRLNGSIPGNAPAKCEAETTVTTTAVAFGMYAWGRRTLPRNIASQGDFIQWMPNVGRPWSVSAVSGVLANAGSSLSSGGGYRSGSALAVVCPATANSGATHTLTSRFRRGVTYTATLWVRSSSATTNFRIRLGVSGDISSSTAVALSSTVWAQHTVQWTPTSDVDQAYLVAEITAATATTFYVSEAMVYETAPTVASQLYGAGGFPPLAILDAGEAHIDTNASAGWTYTTGLGSTYRNGTALRIATGSVTSAACAWRVDPNLMDPDDHTDSIDVEVWARVVTPGTLGTSPRIVAYSGENPNNGGSTTYTREYGSTGVTLTTSRTAFMRLGTLTLDRPIGGKQQWVGIRAAMSTAGSGNLDIDYAVIVPARQRALSPTGKSETGYPKFNPVTVGTNGNVRTLPDLLNHVLSDVRVTSYRSSPGLGGAQLEIGPGDVDVLVNHRTAIPDRTDTNPADTTSVTLQAVRFTPTPRWAQLRDE